MESAEEDFARKLLSTFRVEAVEHVRVISSGLLDLERSLSPGSPPRPDVLEAVFRAAHSLKGAAHAVRAAAVEAVCQSLEGVFAEMKAHNLAARQELMDLLLEAVKVLEELAARAGSGASKVDGGTAELIRKLDASAAKESRAGAETHASTSPNDASPVQRPAAEETVRIPLKSMESLLVQVEEMLIAKLAAGQRAAELGKVLAATGEWRREWAKVQRELRTLGTDSAGFRLSFEKLSEFLRWNEDHWNSIDGKLKTISQAVAHDGRFLGALVDHLHADAKKALMLPFSSILDAFPRIVRDLLRDEGKESEFAVEGAEIAVDRRILQEIKDPLLHLLRNSIDHGIEPPLLRRQKGKPPRGNIVISISSTSGNKVEIRIADDGDGIDVEKVRSSAIKHGLVSQDEAEHLDPDQIRSLIFHSGISTAPMITSISGRGLGLAIVREKVLQLNGSLRVESPPSGGTVFVLVLPHTLSSFRAILVRVGSEFFGIPTAQIDRAARVRLDEINTVENKDVVFLGGRAFPLVRLCDVLEISPDSSHEDAPKRHAQLLIAGAEEHRVAFVIDELLQEQEVLAKGLGPPLTRVRNVSGAAVLGSGKAIAMLNVADLLKSAVKASASPRPTAPEKPGARKRTILIAEDSITTRTLLRNILETAGYDVKTAVDGAEAFATLRTQACDLVVSDVDMPRMNGFDLTTRIKADKKLSQVPVILVTALESRADRERGVDVGADAYIVKGSFEQSDLLAAIGRLIS